jgi:hypothetical protein
MRDSIRIALFLIVFFPLFSASPALAGRGLHGAGSPAWNKWQDRDNNRLALRRANFSVKTMISFPANGLIDNYSSICRATGVEMVGFTDNSSMHNLRTWLLTRAQSVNDTSISYMVLPAFEWNGDTTDPSVAVFGTRGFATSSETDPPSSPFPFILNNDFFRISPDLYLMTMALGNHPVDQKINDDLIALQKTWLALPPPDNPLFLSAVKLRVMDGKFKTSDEAGNYKITYRTKGKKKFTDLGSYLAGESGAYCQFVAPWPLGADGDYFEKKKQESSVMADRIAGCDVTSYDARMKINLDESNYRNALAGGWRVAPTFGLHNWTNAIFSMNINSGYTGTWVSENVLSNLPATAPPNPGAEDAVIDATKAVLADVKANRKTYVSTMYSASQDCAMKLELKDLRGNKIASMGDEITYSNPVRIELSLDYQYNTPKDKMVLESASLVVVYKNGSTVKSRELPFSGVHAPIRNYLFIKASPNEVKNRTFALVIDDPSKIRALYGKATLRMPDAEFMKNSMDYYNTRKRGSSSQSYNAFTAPILLN